MKRRDWICLKYTTDKKILHAIECDSGVTVEVFGDPDNASYEWRLVHDDGLVEQYSDCGYGIPAVALRDGLLAFYGPGQGSESVDLRSEKDAPS